jgi:PAS domain S-box-containing protein
VGYTLEEFKKLKLQDFLEDEVYKIDSSAQEKMQAGETFLFSRKLKRKDGSLIDAEFNARMINDNKILAFIHDVTARNEAEKKITEISEKYQHLFEKTPMPLWVWEVGSLNFIDVNEAAIMQYGYSREEFLKMKVTDVRPESDIENLMIFFDNAPAGYRKAGIWKHKKKDGSLIDVEVTSHDFNYKDKKCRIVLVNDVTEKLIVERRLAESEIKYRTMIEHNQAGIYQTSMSGEILSCNNAFVKMLGYNSKEELFKEGAHALYFFTSRRKEFLDQLLLHRELNNFEIELKRKDGQPVHIIENCYLRKDLVTGDEIIEGTLIDISKRIIAEEALRESLKEVTDYKYALDQAAIVSITDENGIIKYVNENFCKLYQYSANEVIGENHGHLINSGYHSKSFWQKFWAQIKTGKVLKAEVCNKSKDGSLHWGDTTIVPFLNQLGNPYQYVAIRSDITEKRKLERDIIEQQILQQKLITEMTIAAQEKERNELGKELHDNINQILATVKIYLGMAKVKEGVHNGLNLIEQSYEYVDEAMEEIRKLSHSLVAPSLGDIGLYEALEELVLEVNTAGNMEVRLKYEIDKSEMIDDKEELMLYRIVQEQINNIRKYAKATDVFIHFKTEDNFQRIHITDNGVGFDTTKKAKGIGLKNIQSRVEFYSGNLNIISAPGKGCTLEINIPLKKNSI